jgi:hypothetical protein
LCASDLKVDFCGFGKGPDRVDPAARPQYAAWAAFRDALNATGRPIYYSICPHRLARPSGTERAYDGCKGQEYIYAPPREWTRSEQHALANSVLVEYTNTFDTWYQETTWLGCPIGLITNIDAMARAADLSFSSPGSWLDADMLQVRGLGVSPVPHDLHREPPHPPTHIREHSEWDSEWVEHHADMQGDIRASLLTPHA